MNLTILYCFDIYRIMSVNKQVAFEQIGEIIQTTQNYLYGQLKNYRTFLAQSQNQIQNTITMHLSQMVKERQLYQSTISQLQCQINQLKEDNSYLRNEYMNISIKQEQLKKSRERLLQENAEKEERMSILAEQVEKIKGCVSKISELGDNQNIVDFDQDVTSPIKMNKLEYLQTIKEVSEHDLSVTMSLQSFKSEMLESNPSIQNILQPFQDITPKQQSDSKQSLFNSNCQIDNYQDALMILKSYNSNGRAMKMTKKPNIDYQKTNSCQPITKESNKMPEKKKGNQTINKIKKMRKIEDLDLEGRVISKSNQENICFQGNQNYHEHSSSIIESKIEYIQQHNLAANEDKANSSSSIYSTKFVSRVKETLVDLEEPIKKITEIMQNINSAVSHPIKKERIKDNFKKITYVGGLQFVGNCNDNEEPSGFGKFLLNKEVIYQGEWRSGKFHGWGKLVLISFVKGQQKMIIEVDGHFKQGFMEGSVLCTFTTGQRFMGMIKSQSIEKQGTFVSQKGIMTGYWENSKLIYLI